MSCNRQPMHRPLNTAPVEQLEALAAAPAMRQRPALKTAEEALCYAELVARVTEAARAVQAAGVAPGERVAILGEPTAQLVCVVLGVMRAGAVACIVEQNLPPAALRKRIGAAGITALILDSLRLDALQHEPAISDVRVLAMELPASAGSHQLPALAPEDGALALFTSGSTGESKAVLLSHRNLLANAEGVAGATGIGPDDRLLNFMPLYHTNSICNQVLAPLLVGAAIVIEPRFRAEAMEGWLRAHRPSYFTGVPTMFYRLLQHPLSADALRSLRFARCGSAPLSVEMHRRVEAQLGVPLVVSYGCTEATCTTTVNPPDARRVGSVGKVIRHQEVRVTTADGGLSVRPGITGEVCIRGATLMSSLLPGPQPGAADHPVQDGWLRTGDLGHFDADGYLTITGKAKNLIVRGGENLSPESIEHALLQHPGIAQCGVVGVPEAEYGEVPVAFVKPAEEEDFDAVCAAAEAYVRERLSAASVPHFFLPATHFPETGVGKVDRLQMAEWARDALAQRQ